MFVSSFKFHALKAKKVKMKDKKEEIGGGGVRDFNLILLYNI